MIRNCFIQIYESKGSGDQIEYDVMGREKDMDSLSKTLKNRYPKDLPPLSNCVYERRSEGRLNMM